MGKSELDGQWWEAAQFVLPLTLLFPWFLLEILCARCHPTDYREVLPLHTEKPTIVKLKHALS